MGREQAWDQHEAVILLEAYLETLHGDLPRLRIIKRVSIELRQMAKNNGQEISDIYRNENGISFQMRSMESAYCRKTIMKPSTQLFDDIVTLYRTNRSEYEKLLKAAKAMIDGKQTNYYRFIDWLSFRVTPTQLSDLLWAYKEIEQYCLKINVLHMPLLETTDIEIIEKVKMTVDQDMFFRLDRGKNKNIIVDSAIRYYHTFAIERGLARPGSEEPATHPEKISIELLVRSEQDKRLLGRYPIVYRKIFSALREMSNDNPQGVTAVALYDYIKRIARCADIEDILDNVSWARFDNSKYVFSLEKINHEENIEELDEQMEAPLINDHSFYAFLHDNLKMEDTTCRSYVTAISSAERYAKEHQYEFSRLFTVDWREAKSTADALFRDPVFIEYNAQQHNRFHAAITRLLQYLPVDAVQTSINQEPPASNKSYEKVLAEHFRKGFRLGSPLEIRKFRKYYKEIIGEALEADDEEIECVICGYCVLYEEKAFTPQTMLSKELKERLFQYIHSRFNEGKTTLYYQALFKEFSEEFLDYYIYNTDMLKAYLKHMNDGSFYINRSYLSKDANETFDPLEEIRTCLKEYASPVTYDEMFEDLSHIPPQKIRQILATNAEFISNGRCEYFHVAEVNFSDEELDNIAEIISEAIEAKDFLSGNELVNAIAAKYPYCIDKNAAFSMVGLRDAIKYYLGDKFSFKGNIISRSDHDLSMWDVFTDYCRSRDSFSLDELNVLASELGTTIYFDAVYNNSLRINKDQFVSKERANFNVRETDSVLDRFCTGDYISIGTVSEFGSFPDAGFPWNSFLLEHYVAAYSEKYCLIHVGFNGTKCVGAIVKRSTGIESFDDFIVDALTNSSIHLKKQTALQYLFDEGYIARRIYNNIEELIIKATAQRNRKESNIYVLV